MKTWTAQIDEHVARWTARCGRRNIKWRPSLAYHFTDVHNAARILDDGELLSRALAVSTGRMVNENAAVDIIDSTPPEHRRYVRLYFRPRTPTQWRNEGIRGPGARYRQAHCPVPVFFCFDLRALLAEDGVAFSDGSMARPEVRYGDSQELFESIPFELVYHDRAITSDEDKAEIVFRRHAEILAPDRLDLRNLLGVACRSDAEQRTLLHALSPRVCERWRSQIRTVGDPLFFRSWPHLDSVFGVDGVLYLRFRSVRQPVPVRVELFERETGRRWSWEGLHHGREDLRLRLAPDCAAEVTVEVRIHGCVAFRAAVWVREELPF